MTDAKEFTKHVQDTADDPPVEEAWPVEDDFAAWMAGQELTTHAFVCSAPEFANFPFCGIGSH